MKTVATVLFATFASCLFACSKNNKVQTVSGTINGSPALTLYGSSNKAADYIFLSSDSTLREMSYNGILITYINATPPGIFFLNASVAVGKGTLIRGTSVTTLTIDTTYGFTFASTHYSSR